MNKPLIIAHRGITDNQKSINLRDFTYTSKRLDGIEIDLRMTRDSIVVVNHDRRVQNGDARYYWIDKLSLHELRDMHASQIPTFDEVLGSLSKQQLLTKNFLLDLDLKQPGMEKEIVTILKKYSVPKILISSPDIWVLKSFEDLMPEVSVGLTYTVNDKYDFTNVRAFRYMAMLMYYSIKPFIFRIIRKKTGRGDIEVANMHFKMASEKSISFLHQYNIKVYVWGTDRENDLRRLVQLGVDGIKTKNPELLHEILSSGNA